MALEEVSSAEHCTRGLLHGTFLTQLRDKDVLEVLAVTPRGQSTCGNTRICWLAGASRCMKGRKSCASLEPLSLFSTCKKEDEEHVVDHISAAAVAKSVLHTYLKRSHFLVLRDLGRRGSRRGQGEETLPCYSPKPRSDRRAFGNRKWGCKKETFCHNQN